MRHEFASAAASSEFDPAGNRIRHATREVANKWNGPGQVEVVTVGRSYYDPLGQLRVVDKRTLPDPQTALTSGVPHALIGAGDQKALSADPTTTDIEWAAADARAFGQIPIPGNAPKSWFGSLIIEQRDASGLHYRRARYYDPVTGKFTQEDPIGLAGGLNLYGYANGDPVNFSDPFGLCPCVGLVAGATGALAIAQGMRDAQAAWDRRNLDVVMGVGGGLSVAENRIAGLAAESFLPRLFGGGKVSMATSQGMRHLDNLSDGIARESKAGRTFLTARVRSQIAKDVELKNTPGSGVTQVEWHFRPGLTGAGPSVPLREALTKAGIRIVEYK